MRTLKMIGEALGVILLFQLLCGLGLLFVVELFRLIGAAFSIGAY